MQKEYISVNNYYLFLIDIVHSNNIAHRDIKSDNILINNEGKCKIGDLGMSLKIGLKDTFTKTEGNLYFYPPEFCEEKEDRSFALKPVDIWAFGVTIYTCIYKHLPFVPSSSSNPLELFKMIIEEKYIIF